MGTTDHPRVNKHEFISRVAARTGLSIKVARGVYAALFGELTDAARRGETVVLTGFGRFYRQDHKGHKVRFGKEDVPDYSVLKFSASGRVNRRLEIEPGSDPTQPQDFGMIEDAYDVDLEFGLELDAAS